MKEKATTLKNLLARTAMTLFVMTAMATACPVLILVDSFVC